MKKALTILVCAILLSTVGCSKRGESLSSSESAKVAVSSSSQNSEIISSSSSSPASSSESSSSSDASSKSSAPIFTELEQQAINADVHLFADFFGAQTFSATTQLKSEEVLSVCLKSLYLTKDMNAYLFEEAENGNVLIPTALVSDAAKQRLGIDGFKNPASERYVKDKDAYLYNPTEAGASAGAYAIKDISGAEDGTVTYSINFTGSSENAEVYYTFYLKSINGMPYLQLISAREPATASGNESDTTSTKDNPASAV